MEVVLITVSLILLCGNSYEGFKTWHDCLYKEKRNLPYSFPLQSYLEDSFPPSQVPSSSSSSSVAFIKLDIKNRNFSSRPNRGRDVSAEARACERVRKWERERKSEREGEKPWDFLWIRSNNFSRDLSGDLNRSRYFTRSLSLSLSLSHFSPSLLRRLSHSLALSPLHLVVLILPATQTHKNTHRERGRWFETKQCNFWQKTFSF